MVKMSGPVSAVMTAAGGPVWSGGGKGAGSPGCGGSLIRLSTVRSLSSASYHRQKARDIRTGWNGDRIKTEE